MSIGSGWYEETAEDIEHRRLQDIAILSLKQKLDEVFAIQAERVRKGEAIGLRGGHQMLSAVGR